MFTVDVKVGRLLEARIGAPSTLADLDSGQAKLTGFFQAIPGKLVVCADFTRGTVFSPKVADRLLDLFRFDNPKLERSGILISESAIFGLQLDRLIGQAGNPSRKCFRDPFDLKSFLGAVLSHEEHVRLNQFLAERPL
jgi:hypothetical protein